MKVTIGPRGRETVVLIGRAKTRATANAYKARVEASPLGYTVPVAMYHISEESRPPWQYGMWTDETQLAEAPPLPMEIAALLNKENGGSRGVVRTGRLPPTGQRYPVLRGQTAILSAVWKGKGDVLEPGMWENDSDQNPGDDWYAIVDDEGIHTYTAAEDLAFAIAYPDNLKKLDRRPMDRPLFVFGPVPAPGPGEHEPVGWWRVESDAGERIAYAGTRGLAEYIASIGPKNPPGRGFH